jgi:hypothetical protein
MLVHKPNLMLKAISQADIIGIHAGYIVSPSDIQPIVQGGSHSHIAGVAQQDYPFVAHGRDNLRTGIGGPIVDDQ